jgi:predicted ester cyclase
MTTETNKALAASLHHCFDTGDWQKMRTIVAPGVVVHMTGQSGSLDLAALEGAGRAFASAFTQSRTAIKEQIAEGECVCSRTIWTALHSGPFNGIPASHHTISVETITLDRIADGKIVEHRGSMDVMGLLTQIGALPAAA